MGASRHFVGHKAKLLRPILGALAACRPSLPSAIWMAPKGKNVASGSGTKSSRKGAAVGSSSREPNNLPSPKIQRASCNVPWKGLGESGASIPFDEEFTGTSVLYKLRKKFMICAPPRSPHLVCRLVDVTRTKAHDPSQGPILTAIDRQARDDSWMGRMFGMAELQLRIGDRQVTEDEMAALVERCPLTNSVMYMCQIGPGFEEPIDGDDATTDEEDGSTEDESDDTGLGDDDTDVGDGDGEKARRRSPAPLAHQGRDASTSS
ncbi:hypothetical protein H5410_004912 [Solanum commersonii]|uniref:Uncharacterized protein n=1 Tax=Solanum commersonii TaxID=4109 RepID=A0A9J6A4Z2_SOLCO|nr:hypothetical protein H5410_004912 [Solanum commersonii]